MELKVTEKRENQWEVLSSDEEGKTHKVQQVSSDACTCSIKCPLCSACTHTFNCTCMDFAIRGVVCQHIHAASITGQRDGKYVEAIIEDVEATMEDGIEKKPQRLSELIPKNFFSHASTEEARKKDLKEFAETFTLISLF